MSTEEKSVQKLEKDKQTQEPAAETSNPIFWNISFWIWIVTSVFFVFFWFQEWRSPGYWYIFLHGDPSDKGRALKILSDNPLIGKFKSSKSLMRNALMIKRWSQ